MAAGDLPPYVASGQPIQSAWGNAVVDELLRKRNEKWQRFQHDGGFSPFTGRGLIGTQNIGPFTYPTLTVVVANFRMGYAALAVAMHGDVSPLDGNPMAASGSEYVQSPYYLNHTVSWAWDVAAGQNGGFTTNFNWDATEGSPNGVYYSCYGIWMSQRVGSP